MAISRSARNRVIGIIILCIVICGAFAILTTRGCSIGGTRMNESYSSTFPADEVNSINIDFPAGSLDVSIVGDDNDISIVEYASESAIKQSTPTCELNDGTLTITYQHNPIGWFPWFWFGNNRKLEVRIPENIASTLDVFKLHLLAGEAEIPQISADEMEIKVTSGQASLNGLTSDKATLELSSGKLDIIYCDFEDVNAHVTSGTANINGHMGRWKSELTSGSMNVEFTNSEIEAIEAKTTSGTLTLALPKNANFDAAATKTSGQFICEFDCQVRGETYVYGDGKTPIDISLTSGQVILKPLD